MKIVYIVYTHTQVRSGVLDKIICQIETWRKLGHEVTPIIFSLDETVNDLGFNCVLINYSSPRKGKWMKKIISLFKMRSIVRKINPDIVYSRCGSISKLAQCFISNYKHIVEINADPKGETTVEAIFGIAQKNAANKKYKRLNEHLSRADGIVSVTKSILNNIRESKLSEIVPNSIDIVEIGTELEKIDRRGQPPRVLFIGSPGRAWHGLDRLLELARATQNELEFVVAGTEMSDSNLSPNIILKGYLGKDELDDEMKNVDIGISSMSLYLSGHIEACPLKTRSYASALLPMILPYEETAFLVAGSKPDWALELSNGDGFEEGEIDQVVEFCRHWQGKRIPADEAELYFGSESLERKRLQFFSQVAFGTDSLA